MARKSHDTFLRLPFRVHLLSYMLSRFYFYSRTNGRALQKTQLNLYAVARSGVLRLELVDCLLQKNCFRLESFESLRIIVHIPSISELLLHRFSQVDDTERLFRVQKALNDKFHWLNASEADFQNNRLAACLLVRILLKSCNQVLELSQAKQTNNKSKSDVQTRSVEKKDEWKVSIFFTVFRDYDDVLPNSTANYEWKNHLFASSSGVGGKSFRNICEIDFRAQA